MPAATTHVEFSRDVLALLPPETRSTITNIPIYFLGSQGPDLLFFSRWVVLPGSLYSKGGLMHSKNTHLLLNTLKELCASDSDLYSYYMGFLTHYALDSMVHPSVYYFAGTEAKATGRAEIECHFIAEGCIDVHVLKAKNRTIDSYSVYNDLKIPKAEAKKLGVMYHELFKRVYGQDEPASKFTEAALGTSRLTALLAPTSMKKYQRLHKLESLFKAPHLITGMMLLEKDGDHAPILNLDHLEYDVPGQPGTRENRSVMELYEAAYPYALKLMSGFTEADIQKEFHGILIQE